jgi:hypothetical protein
MNKDLFGNDIPCTDKIIEQVVAKLRSRSNIGLKKYNTTVWENVDENYENHLLEELLDACVYQTQKIRLGEFTTRMIKLIESTPNDKELGEEIRKEYFKLMEI